ncbi:helix-turn-helix domain-containing protein [Marinomonas fungiae]|uniref:Transcriptional regulator, contains XRE-family HTH domain n=1 Tax=Marinomonas fungiae TaxID=1137284 RepID=A0A0K6IKC1_9GAMM|nr:helix-turn-helix transcriptional regulator [Marinomonas fungiae]CUB03531.1 Transcriptional regulator, contains XRE-family HTH domain [Marinomonas fungiae]
MNVDKLIASKIKASRKRLHLTLDALAERSGISRSMISLIERGQSSPTAAVLNRLTDALGMSLPELFSDQLADNVAAPHCHSSLGEQKTWKDPESGYIRRQLTPRNAFSTVELTEITFPAKQRVTFDNMLRNIEIHQQVWMLAGEIIISDDESSWHLKQGDCLVFKQKEHTIFSNPSEVEARYLIALTSLPNT